MGESEIMDKGRLMHIYILDGIFAFNYKIQFEQKSEEMDCWLECKMVQLLENN